MKNTNTTLLPENLHSILIGIMLGDGHIYKTSPTSNSRFEMSFGKDRLLFAQWIHDYFINYSKGAIEIIKFKKEPSIEITNFNYRFKTKTLPIFNYYYSIFYEANNDTWKYKKIVPHNIFDLMNFTVLAYLIMTDGNFYKSRNRVRIYTNSYSKLEVQRLAKAISLNLNIYVGILHDRKDQWILTIGAKQFNLLREAVSPHF